MSFLEDISDQLIGIPGVRAVVLGGSRADDTFREDSDYDFGLYYGAGRSLDIEAVRRVATALNDTPDPVVTGPGEWGRWVNGGAWLTVGGRRVDLLYRDLDFVRAAVRDCRAGRKESDYYQQPPYGFHSYMYCAELRIGRVLHDPEGLLATLKEEVRDYPEALKKTVVGGFLWNAEFTLHHAAAAARRGDVFVLAGCLTRIAADLVQVLYALNDEYFLSEKKLALQVPGFRLVPERFVARLDRMLGDIGTAPPAMQAVAGETRRLFDEMVVLAEGYYIPRFKL